MTQGIKNYNFNLEPTNKAPVAIILPADQQAVVGSLVKLDGTASFDPEDNDLTFFWAFSKVPIGSQVEKTGFNFLESDNSIVSFAPDVTGPYEIQLVVSDGSIDSDPTLGEVDVRVLLVPHNAGYIPDATFIWRYLSDFWPKVDGHTRIETLWSAAIQMIASQQLKLYQYDYNKSIKDIQELFQRRWLSYHIELSLDPTKSTFILADDQAGLSVSSVVLDPVLAAPAVEQPDTTGTVLVPLSEGNFVSAAYRGAIAAGRLLRFGGRTFTMLRSVNLFKSLNYGTDGAQVAATNRFQGSNFNLNLAVGDILRVFSGTTYTEYKLSGFISEAEALVTTLTGGSVSFAAASDLTYTVLPAAASHSSFTADQARIPGKLEGEAWRFSATLISAEFDFEAQGVSPGDLLDVSILRQDLALSTVLTVQVVSVDRNRLGFVFNRDTLVDGVRSGGLSVEDQIAITNALKIPGLFIQSTDGSLGYSDQAAVLKTTISTPLFKRENFEKVLSSLSTIDLGLFKVSLTPQRIVRLSKIPIELLTISIPVLQEYIKQPKLTTKNGQLFQVSEDTLFPLSREPYLLIENLNYIVDDDSTLRGTCNVTAGSDLISIPFGDLIERGVIEGDVFLLSIGSAGENFTVKKRVDDQTIQVFPTPTITSHGAQYQAQRRIPGKFVRFVGGSFDKTKSVPRRLWAEVAYFDNSPSVEDNFGVMVGISRERLRRQNVQVPYKSAVAGLMYALATGPTIADIGLSANILLGLPFTQNAGVIIQINPDYRIRDDGSPRLGRILIEARDATGASLGITNIYFYQQGAQRQDLSKPGGFLPVNPELSGIADNPKTGLPYSVGDIVDQFVPLAKGIEILDYLNSSWARKFVSQGDNGTALSQYHAFELLVNSDVVGPADIDLTAQFIKTAKPHYIKLITAFQKTIEDQVKILDNLKLIRPYHFFENIGLGLPTAVKFDYPDAAPEDFVSLEGQDYAYFISGSDLETVQGSTTVISATGGFVTAPVGASYDSPFIRATDVLIIYEGSNAGRYVVGSVGSDTDLNGLTRLDGSAFTFETRSNQEFAVYRPVRNPIFQGSVTGTNGDPILTETSGLFSAGVAPGDRISFSGIGGGFSNIIVAVDADAGTITLKAPFGGTTGTHTGTIIRDHLLTKYFLEKSATSFSYISTFTAGSPWIELSTFGPSAEETLVLPGWEIVDDSGLVYTILDAKLGFFSYLVYVTPAPTVNGLFSVQIRVPNLAETPISMDILDRIPGEYLSLTLKSAAGDLDTTATSPTITTVSGEDFSTLGIVPGDFLVIREGADSTVDLGYGAGLYPIAEITGAGLNLLLTQPLSANGAALLYGIQRRNYT